MFSSLPDLRTFVRSLFPVAVVFLAATGHGAPNRSSGDLLARYVAEFNAADEELYTNAIPNTSALEFMRANCPLFSCSDKDVERTYYFRWWTYRKHLRKDLGCWTVSEFLPSVGWAGPGNTIVCPAGHHLLEGRWLRDAKYASECVRFWLSDKRAWHRWGYSSWLMTGACKVAVVTGQDALPAELLDSAVGYYRRWEKGFPRSGLVMGGDGKGGFMSADNYEGSEISLGGNGYRPLFACAMWSEANEIAKTARRIGRTALADEFAKKAEANRQSVIRNCWNPDLGFFTTARPNGEKGIVRELHGYSPWYFGMPTDGQQPDWTQLTDVGGFAARFGLSFPERRAQGFKLAYEGHECQWNGPSWPFATSIALTAYLNWLHGNVATRKQKDAEAFTSLLTQYAGAHRLDKKEKDGRIRKVCWIDENLNPDTGDWIARTLLLRRKQKPFERGKDYNHSTFCDLVLSGLVGFVPQSDGGFIVDPLAGSDIEYFSLENLRYRGHEVSISWSRPKREFVVSADGKACGRRNELGLISVTGKK